MVAPIEGLGYVVARTSDTGREWLTAAGAWARDVRDAHVLPQLSEAETVRRLRGERNCEIFLVKSKPRNPEK